MSRLLQYVRSYLNFLLLPSFFLVSLILSVLVAGNYIFSFNAYLVAKDSFSARLLGFTGLYLPAFAGAYLLTFLFRKPPLKLQPAFFVLMLAAPVIFAAKVSVRVSDVFDESFVGAGWADYFRIVLQWPLKALVVLVPLFLLAVIFREERPAFGLRKNPGGLMPYFGLLLLMVPLLLAAGLTADFQEMYPRLAMIDAHGVLPALFFELSYGLDFFTIELFFRGFLVVAFIKYAGRHAILPMAVFYCTIHFGKPLAECVSSYFGGLVLGAVVYETRSIWGGLIAHLGIAWLMELIGIVF